MKCIAGECKGSTMATGSTTQPCPSAIVLNFACTVTKSMLLDTSNSQHQTRRLATPVYRAGRENISPFTSLPRVPVASALNSMSSFLLHSLISDGRTFRVTTGLSLLMAPARHRYDRLQGKKERRRGGKENVVMLTPTCTCGKTTNGLSRLVATLE